MFREEPQTGDVFLAAVSMIGAAPVTWIITMAFVLVFWLTHSMLVFYVFCILFLLALSAVMYGLDRRRFFPEDP